MHNLFFDSFFNFSQKLHKEFRWKTLLMIAHIGITKMGSMASLVLHELAWLWVIYCLLQFFKFSQKLPRGFGWNFTQTFHMIGHSSLSKMVSGKHRFAWLWIIYAFLRFFNFSQKLLKGFGWSFTHTVLVIDTVIKTRWGQWDA